MIYNKNFPIISYQGRLAKVITTSLTEGCKYVQIEFICTNMNIMIPLIELH
jgi:hypothetical protein